MCPECKNQARPTPCPVCAESARAVGDTSYAAAKAMYAAGARDRGEPENNDPYYTGRAREFLTRVYAEADVDFVLCVLAEVTKARAKFGGQPSLVTGLALAEELGEVDLAVALGAKGGAAIRKLLHISEGKSGEDDLVLECKQTAAMALRLATESADRKQWPGNRRGCGGSYEVGSGGHVPGTPGEGCSACDRDFGVGLVDDRATYTGDHMEAPSKFKRRID